MSPIPMQSPNSQRSIYARRAIVFSVAVAGIGISTFALGNAFYHPAAHAENAANAMASQPTASVLLDPDNPNAIRIASTEKRAALGLETAEVKPAGASEPLRLPGSLALDPSRFIRVNARFSGEVVRIGMQQVDGQERQLQFGDKVQKGQLLAVIWSKDIGEKKSDLIDAYSRLELNKALLRRLESLSTGVVSQRQIDEARRQVEADTITASKVERTLRSWRLSDEEIASVRREAELVKDRSGQQDPSLEKSWAETEVRAAMDGLILEKNINVGDIVEQTDDLFKIADLSRLRVIAHIYEEDLWTIRTLSPEARKWRLDLKSDPGDNAIEGTFELIGNVIDPGARTGVVMGWLENTDGKLAVGQFITASIALPENLNEVAIPEKALIEEGDRSMIFVQDPHDENTFARRRVSIARRTADTVFLNAQPSPRELAASIEGVSVGEKIVVTNVLGFGGELEKVQSMAPPR
jgi:cobalt-zinc-cadmium efflux system membrane fusion protein